MKKFFIVLATAALSFASIGASAATITNLQPVQEVETLAQRAVIVEVLIVEYPDGTVEVYVRVTVIN